MTPAECIASLDSALADKGQNVVLQRMTLGPSGRQIPFSVTCKAFVRGYDPDQWIGGLTQHDSKVIISPTEITAAGWTNGRLPPDETRVPIRNNKVVVAGATKNVEAGFGFYVGGELVRIEMQVKG